MDRCFFGFEIDQVGSGGDPVTFFLEPLSNLDLGNAFANGRNDDISHVMKLFMIGTLRSLSELLPTKAYSNSASLSSAWKRVQFASRV